VSAAPRPLEAVVRPRSPLRLPRRNAPDGVMRFSDGVLTRLLHVDAHPVVVRAWQTRSGEVHLNASRGTAVVGPAAAVSREALEVAIERMRFALGVDDDLSEFYKLFKQDPLIGPIIRRKPWLRPRKRPWPWEAFAWGVTAQLIESVRAAEIQRRMVRRWGSEGDGGLRDVPGAAVIAGLSPAELVAVDLAEKRAVALIRAAKEVAADRVDLSKREDDARLLSIREIGPWTVQLLGLGGRGDFDSLPAGDLAYVKLVGRLAGRGRRATVEEVEEFFAPYAPYRGLAGTFATIGLHKRIAQGPPLRFAA
jgi:DNA-3-methyladenine glycosylase II